MKKFITIMGIAALMTGISTGAMAPEQKAKRNPEVRKMVQEQEYQKKMAEARARQEAAQKMIDEAKGNK